MAPLIALWFALLHAQATTPAAPQSSEPPTAQTDQQPAIPQTPPVKIPRPNPDASGKYHLGDGVTPPKVIYQVDPDFSEQAQKKKIGGSIMVSLTVDAEGKPEDVHISHSMADTVDKKLRAVALSLDEKALEAVKLYRFAPATYQGKPVPVELNVEVNFQIF